MRIRSQVLEQLMTTYSEHINLLTVLHSSQKCQFFKPSTRKDENEYRFMPCNLGLTRLEVKNNSTENTFYDSITFGVGSDHVAGYKSGGLLKFLIKSAEYSGQQINNEKLFHLDRYSR